MFSELQQRRKLLQHVFKTYTYNTHNYGKFTKVVITYNLTNSINIPGLL